MKILKPDEIVEKGDVIVFWSGKASLVDGYAGDKVKDISMAVWVMREPKDSIFRRKNGQD